jgi:CMP-N,N'-diacetyllegionaminic acid synthase
VINGKRVLAIIPARGGSKGIPRKNIAQVAGKPLIAWTIEEAKKSRYIDRLILSSEDPEIIEVAKLFGCDVPFVRPKEIAMDDTPGIDPVIHACKELPGYEYVVLLQPTSPLRLAVDIDSCIEKCEESSAPACVSVTEPDKSPYWMYSMESDDKLKPIMKEEKRYARRQDIPKVYALNGAVYVGKSDWVMEKRTFVTEETVAYIMPTTRSIDIDVKTDLLYADTLLNHYKNGIEMI